MGAVLIRLLINRVLDGAALDFGGVRVGNLGRRVDVPRVSARLGDEVVVECLLLRNCLLALELVLKSLKVFFLVSARSFRDLGIEASLSPMPHRPRHQFS